MNKSKYQEALDRIGRNYYLSQESGDFEHFENLYLENKKTLQELVDKETPKKPIEYLHIAVDEYDDNETKYECPHCHIGECRKIEYDRYEDDYTYTEDDRCDVCGGLLDWSEDE